MNYLIKDVVIIDPYSSLNGQKANLFIQRGILTQISTDVIAQETNTKVIVGKDLHASAGWMDMRCAVKDPGFEHKETLQTVRKAAAFGGFTSLLALPNTSPVVQSKNEIAYLTKDNPHSLVQIYPVAAVSLEAAGKQMSEMLDLDYAGAVAFSDGEHPVWNTDLLLKTLIYLQQVNSLLIQRPEDTLLTRYGMMNEGVTSTLLGLKGIPALAEELMIRRDLELLRYAGGKIHFSLISSAGTVELIRQAKKEGLQVSCDVAAHQFALDESRLLTLDSYLKVNPPLRTKEDIAAIKAGLMDGTIDVIVSDHHPQDEESKNLEFDLAEFGMIGLETAFAVTHTFFPELSLEQLVDKMAIRPRQLLGFPVPQIAVGEPANLTLFDPQKEWVFDLGKIQSKSKNSPFIGQAFKGKALGVINNQQLEAFDF